MDFLKAKWKLLLILFIALVAFVTFIIKFKDRIVILGEFLSFLKERKLWWMTPIIIVFLLLSILIVITEKSAVMPFIYMLF